MLLSNNQIESFLSRLMFDNMRNRFTEDEEEIETHSEIFQ